MTFCIILHSRTLYEKGSIIEQQELSPEGANSLLLSVRREAEQF